MAGFLTPLKVQFIDGRRWRVIEAFEYALGAPDGTERVIVPAGFLTDFASVPRGLWNLLPPAGLYGKAAVLHDYLYRYRRLAIIPAGVRLVSRGEADHIFLEAMGVLGVRWRTRMIVYGGVRLFGGATWRRHQNGQPQRGG